MDDLGSVHPGPDPSLWKWAMPQLLFRNAQGFINPTTLRFIVTEGIKMDSRSVERTHAIGQCGQTIATKLLHPRVYDTPAVCRDSAFKYTYVCLQLKISFPVHQRDTVPHGKRIWMETSEVHHITMAYLPYITQVTRIHMEQDLNNLIADWLRSGHNVIAKPEDRARACLSFRQITSRGEDLIFQSHDIVDLSFAQLMGDARKGLAWLRAPGPHHCNLTDLPHFYHREMARVKDAVSEAFDAQIGPNTPIDVDLKECVVTEFSDIYSLLYYTKERLVTKHRIWSLDPIEDIGLIHSDAWHITPICIEPSSPLVKNEINFHIFNYSESVQMSRLHDDLIMWFETHFLAMSVPASP
jgi:hypothetical protein